jgi:hypothetical protein
MNNTTDNSDTIKTGMEIGVITLGEFLADPQNGRKISAQQRIREIVQAVQLADEAGLDVIRVGGTSQP